MFENLEKELKRWRQSRGRKTESQAPADRRTVKVNGQEVIVVKKVRKASSSSSDPSTAPSS